MLSDDIKKLYRLNRKVSDTLTAEYALRQKIGKNLLRRIKRNPNILAGARWRIQFLGGSVQMWAEDDELEPMYEFFGLSETREDLSFDGTLWGLDTKMGLGIMSFRCDVDDILKMRELIEKCGLEVYPDKTFGEDAQELKKRHRRLCAVERALRGAIKKEPYTAGAV